MNRKLITTTAKMLSTRILELLPLFATALTMIAIFALPIKGRAVLNDQSEYTYTVSATEIAYSSTKVREPMLPICGAAIEAPLEEPIELPYCDNDVVVLSRMVWGEARGLSPDEQRLTVWTVFQRVDHPYTWGDTIEAVITQPWQFIGYSPNNPICPEIYARVCEELNKWQSGEKPPTLYPFAPSIPYYFFDSDLSSSPVPHNFFREKWK